MPGFKSLSYSGHLLRLNLESLESRRVKADLVLLFKIIHGFVDIDYSAVFDIQFNRTTSTRGHDLRIRKCQTRSGLTIRVELLSIDYRGTLCFKNQLIRLRSLEDGAFGVTEVLSKFDNFNDVRNCHPLFCSVPRRID